MSKIKVDGEWLSLGIDTVNGISPDEDGNVTVNAEDPTNKVTTLASSSTDTQYPSAKAVYDNIITRERIGKLTVDNTEYDIRIMGATDTPTAGILYIKLED